LLRLALWPKIWSTLEKVPWAAEKYIVQKHNILCRCSSDPFNFRVSFISFVWTTHLLVIEEYWRFPLPLCWGLSVFLNPSVCV
jgi:hypothetical protein